MSAHKRGKQRMLYVLLPRRTKCLPLPQSFQSTETATELNSPSQATKSCQSTSTSVPSEAYVSVLDDSVSTKVNDTTANDFSVVVSSDDDKPSIEDKSDSDYTEPGDNVNSNGVSDEDLPVELVGRKRPRDGNETEGYTSGESGILTTRGKARRRSKRSRRAVLSDDSSEEESSTNPGSFKPKPKGLTKPSAFKAVVRKKAKRKQTQSGHSATPSFFSDDRLFVHPQGNNYKFTFKNHICAHSLSPNLHQGVLSAPISRTWPNPITQDSPSDFDTSCVALSGFNMCFFRPLNMVFCRTHKVCVPLSSLETHITAGTRQRHTGTMTGPSQTNLIEPFLSHVASAFHLPLTQTFYSQGSDTKQLSEPIPYMDQPCLYLQCPLCKNWLLQSRKGGWKSQAIKRHLKKSNSKCAQLLEISESERPVLKECYGQRPCGTRGLNHIPFVEIVGWNPETAPPFSTDSHLNERLASSAKHATPTTNLVSQEYVESCKWNTHFPASIAEALHELCLLPNPFFFISGDGNGENKNIDEGTLERGLYEVQIFLRHYLEDANSFIDTCEVGFRSTLTRG